MGVGYESNGAAYTAAWNNGVNSFITKQNYGVQMAVHAQRPQPVGHRHQGEPAASGAGWSLIGTVETGFNPYYGYLADAQRSQVQNNGKALALQGANADSSRTGQWDNSQGFIGLSNKTYGTLTVGRVNTLSLDAINSYDPMGGSYAFSPLGFSGSFAGFGDTEAARANTAVKYRVEIPEPSFYGANFRLGGLVQWGGYDQGNGTNGLYQGQAGADFNLFQGTPYGGVLSMDFIGSWAKDAANMGTFTGTCATLKTGPCWSDQLHVRHSKVLWQHRPASDAVEQHRLPVRPPSTRSQALTVFGGYGWIKQANPSDDYLNGFKTIGGWNVPATITSTNPAIKKLFPTAWTNFTNYNVNRIAPYFWVGAKYAITPQIDVTGAYYYQQQSDFNTSACTYGEQHHRPVRWKQARREPRQQQQMRGHAGRLFRPHRLSSGQARRPLRRLDAFECLRWVRERLPGDPEHRPDRGPARQVLTPTDAEGGVLFASRPGLRRASPCAGGRASTGRLAARP